MKPGPGIAFTLLTFSVVVHARNVLQPATKSTKQKPWFCHDLDCPLYDLLNKTDAYEVRKYQSGRWVSTHADGLAYEQGVAVGFQRLFKYISGNNEGKKKVDMTSPVTVQTTPGQGPACKSDFLVSFFLPFKYQEKPPKPADSSIFFTDVPEITMYVAQHGGMIGNDKIIAAKIAELVSELKDDGESFEGSLVFTANYDPPFRLQHRHNEIWIAAARENVMHTIA
uniref:Putative extracellular protein TR9_073a n=1 Tax=Trebouxia lynnae TaxID=1825957 RepID=A0A7L9QEK3_9CHLO|nr:putative extracellular protein TR9_073a [Trebouxia lynnae]